MCLGCDLESAPTECNVRYGWRRAGRPRPYEGLSESREGADKCKRRNELRDYEQDVRTGGETPPLRIV